MDFSKEIKKIIDKVPGSIGGMLLGNDGIILDFYLIEGVEADPAELGAELSALLQNIVMVSNTMALGDIEHFWIVTKYFKIMVSPITSDYFIALLFDKSAYIGQGQFALQLHRDALESDLI